MEEEFKRKIEDVKEKLPLSYHLDLTFRDKNLDEALGKIFESEKYNDKSYSIVSFYKSITRF